MMNDDMKDTTKSVANRESLRFLVQSYIQALTCWFTRPSSNRTLLAIILLGHIYGLSLGAVFWVDSGMYILFANYFGPIERVQQFYSSTPGIFWLPGGVALLWHLASQLPIEYIWPTVAVVQHVCAIISQYLVFHALNKAWPSRIHLVFCALMSFLPFYQSMHNALMTESLSTSFLLVSVAASINILKKNGNGNLNFVIMALGIFMAIQFRYAILILAAPLFFVLMILRAISLRRFAIASVVVVLAAVAWPVYKHFLGAPFTMPDITFVKLDIAAYTFPETPPAAMEYAKSLDWPDHTYIEKLSKGFHISELHVLADYWLSKGYSMKEISEMSNEFFLIARNNQKIEYHIGNLAMSLTAAGLTAQFYLLPKDWIVFKGYTPAAMAKHQRQHFRYLSWTSPSKQEYEDMVMHYFPTRPDAPEKALFIAAWTPYLNFSPEYPFRDPFRFGKLPPDFFAFAGILSILLLIIMGEKTSCLFFVPICIHVVFYLLQYMGAIRYSYPVIMMHIIVSSILIAKVFLTLTHNREQRQIRIL